MQYNLIQYDTRYASINEYWDEKRVEKRDEIRNEMRYIRWDGRWDERWVERLDNLRDEISGKMSWEIRWEMKWEMRWEMVVGANSELKTRNFFFNTTRVIPNGKYSFIVTDKNVP